MNVEKKKDVFGFVHDYRAISKQHLYKFSMRDRF